MASEIILLSFSVFVVLFLGVGAFTAKYRMLASGPVLA